MGELVRNIHNPCIYNPVLKLLALVKYCMFAASMKTLQMLPLILENSPFPCIIAIFLNKILLVITTLTFLSPLTFLAWDLKPFYCRLSDMGFHFLKKCLWHVSHAYNFSSNDFTVWHNSTVGMSYFSCLNNSTLCWCRFQWPKMQTK